MPDLPLPLLVLGFLPVWVGHACIWTHALNDVYGRPYSKVILRPWRMFTGIIILAFPLLPVIASYLPEWGLADLVPLPLAYFGACLILGAIVFPAITLYRLLRRPPSAVVSVKTETIDFGIDTTAEMRGSGKWAWAGRIPFNDIYRVDFTHVTLALPGLPASWDGLTILLLSDLHFHGTPGRAFFDRVMDRLTSDPPPDLVCLAGDFVDSDTHGAWIGPILGRLKATAGKFAILGNHDDQHHPAALRQELAGAGYQVVGNGWAEATARGQPFLVVGNEGPWFTPPPDLSAAPTGLFRLCISHTPDNFYWGQRHGIHLMLCGHVHGGQIRIPVVGPIFIPSVYGRRFDSGVFAGGGTVMTVGRGLSGKEPLRFRCHPQVVRITLRPA
jgi:predicted MPP superfamily phosphohydrolase